MIPTQALLFNTVLDILTREIRKKKNEMNPNWRKRSKTSTVSR